MIDLGRIIKAPDVVAQAKDRWTTLGIVTTNALKNSLASLNEYRSIDSVTKTLIISLPLVKSFNDGPIISKAKTLCSSI